MDRVARMVTSKRFVVYIATLAVLAMFALLGLPADVTAPLSEGVAWALVAFMGTESAADGLERFARARAGRTASGRSSMAPGLPSVPPAAPSREVEALDRASLAMATFYGANWRTKVTAGESVGARGPIVRDFHRVLRGETPLGPHVPVEYEPGTSLEEPQQVW